MASGQKQKSNIIAYTIVIILILIILGIIFSSKIKNLFVGKDQPTTKEEKVDKEPVKSIADLIKEAKKKGDEAKSKIEPTTDKDKVDKLDKESIKDAIKLYEEAIEILNKAKNSKKPAPTSEENQIIDDLIKEYTDKLNDLKKKLKDIEDKEVEQDRDKDKKDDKTSETDKTGKDKMPLVIAPVGKRYHRGTVNRYMPKWYGKTPYPTRKTHHGKVTPRDTKKDGTIDNFEKPDGGDISKNANRITTDGTDNKKEPKIIEGPNPIDQLIKEAEELGKNGDFINAISKLNNAKSFENPKPNDTQSKKIDDLIKQFSKGFIDQKIAEAEKKGDAKQYKEAIDLLENLKKNKDPKPDEDQDKKIDTLIGKYTQALKDNDTSEKNALADQYFKRGMQELQEGNYDEAIKNFDKATEVNPKHAPAHSYKGTAYYKKNDLNRAVESSNKAHEIDPDEPNAHFTKGEIYYSKFQDNKADEHFKKVIEKENEEKYKYFDNAPYAYFKLGVIKLLSSQNKEGIEMFDKAIAKENKLNNNYRRNAYYDRGVGKERLKDLDGAEADYKKALELDSKYAKAHIQLGEIYYKKKQFDKATETLKNGLESNPNSYEMAFLLAKTYETQSKQSPDKMDSAIQNYEKAAELNPKSFEALYNTGRLYLVKKNYNKALENFNKANAIKSDDYALNADFGAAYFGLKQYDNSIEKYNTAAKSDPKRVDSYIGLGGVYFAKSKQASGQRNKADLDKSIENLEKANEINPNIFEVNKTLGTAYFLVGNKEKSINALSKAVSIKDNDYTAQKNLASVYFANKNYEKAIPHFEKAISLNEKDANNYLLLGESYFKIKNNDKAKEAIQNLITKFPDYKKQRKVRVYMRILGITEE